MSVQGIMPSRAALAAMLFSEGLGLTGAERSAAAAAIMIGTITGSIAQASFAAVADRAGVTTSGLKKMRHRGAGAPILSWSRGTLTVHIDALAAARCHGDHCPSGVERGPGRPLDLIPDAAHSPVPSRGESDRRLELRFGGLRFSGWR